MIKENQLKLVLCYNHGSEVCSFDEHLPFDHESAEAALLEFEALVKAAISAREEVRAAHSRRAKDVVLMRCGAVADWQVGSRFTFKGLEFDASNFIVDGKPYLPDIYTLDEWFDRHRIDQSA